MLKFFFLRITVSFLPFAQTAIRFLSSLLSWYALKVSIYSNTVFSKHLQRNHLNVVYDTSKNHNTTFITTYERNFLKKKISWTSITIFYMFLRYLWKSSQLLSRKKVFQTSAGLIKAHAAESFPSDMLKPCHLIREWTRTARDSSDALVYAHREIKLLEKLWKYINANHSSVRETVKGTSCAVRLFLKCMDKSSLSIPLAFPLRQHCSLFEANTSGEFLKAFPKRLRSLYIFQGINQKLLINNNKKR